MKILLVNPINRYAYQSNPDLGLGYLATALKKVNHNVLILDCINNRFTFEKFEEYINSSDFDVVGFKIFSTDLASARKCLQIVKRHNSNTIIIVGGIHPSILPQETLEYFSEADFAFRGEAEIGLPKLVNKLPKLDKEEKSIIPGLIWRNNSKIISNPPMLIENLDSLGMPDWNLIDPRNYNFQSSYFTKSKTVAPLIMTRGCPYCCTFCSCHAVTGRKIRTHSVNYIIDEMKFLSSKLGIKEVCFLDDNIIAVKDILTELCRQMIKQKLGINWSCFGIRIDLLDKDILILMEKASCYLISVGIESGSQKILDHMQKKLTIEIIKEKIFLIKEVTNIKIAANFILGYPLENKRDLSKTIKFARSLPLFAATFYKFYPIPATPIYSELIAKKESRENINRYLINKKKKAYIPKDITPRKFLLLYYWAYISFYARPSIFLNILKNIRSVEMFKFLSFKLLRKILKIV